MSETPNEREWIDADAWVRFISGDSHNDSLPLNFSQAAEIAIQGGFPYEHQSSGVTLIKVGAAAVIAARRV